MFAKKRKGESNGTVHHVHTLVHHAACAVRCDIICTKNVSKCIKRTNFCTARTDESYPFHRTVSKTMVPQWNSECVWTHTYSSWVYGQWHTKWNWCDNKNMAWVQMMFQQYFARSKMGQNGREKWKKQQHIENVISIIYVWVSAQRIEKWHISYGRMWDSLVYPPRSDGVIKVSNISMNFYGLHVA